MPLSGPHGSQGRKLAQIIKLGLEENLQGMVETTTYDVSTEDYAKQAIAKMQSKNTKLILGPLFTPSVQFIEEYARKNNVIILTLSNNPALAKENMVYIFGHQPLRQIDFLIKYFASKSHDNFMLLAPKSKNSDTLKKVISELAGKQNTRLCKSYFYSNKMEIKEILTNLSDDIDGILEDETQETRPVILVMDDNTDNLKNILDEVVSLKLDKKAIIAGDGRIDIEYSNDINFIFVGSSKVANADLINKMRQQLSINHPNHLEWIAYDVGALAASSINISFDYNGFLSRIKSQHWYKGLSGDIMFQDAIAQRKYSILERQGQKYKIIASYN